MRRLVLLTILACSIMAPGHAGAAVTNDIPSCYAANKIPVRATSASREIFVLVDQTTLLDEKLQRSGLENLWNFLDRDVAFTVVAFSAFSQGRYTEVVSTGWIEPAMAASERDSTGVRLLKTFDECMKGQLDFARQRAINAVKKTFAESSGSLAKSDILAALKDLSRRVKASAVKDRVIFMVSDMLENSSISSFYNNAATVRVIDPTKELAAAEKADVIGDFGGGRIFVLGAGLLGPSANAQDSYRDAKTMAALREFWAQYFSKSGAKLEQFGQPALLMPLR